MAEKDDAKVTADFLGGMMKMTLAQWDLIAEAGQRCGLRPDEFILKAALAHARRLVPAACHRHDGDVEMPSGLFGKKRGGDEQTKVERF